MLREFRDFLMRGNIVDLAVAFVAGTVFGAVVNSLVKHVKARCCQFCTSELTPVI